MALFVQLAQMRNRSMSETISSGGFSRATRTAAGYGENMLLAPTVTDADSRITADRAGQAG